jgi:hypothetical protein
MLKNTSCQCCHIERMLEAAGFCFEPLSGHLTWQCEGSRDQRPLLFQDRTTPVRSGPEWGASQKHRLPDTPEQAGRPVSEGPQKIQGQAVRQTLHRVNRCRHGALGLGGFVLMLASELIARSWTERVWIS